MISRGEYGVLGPEDNCWPQMACTVPSNDDEVLVTAEILMIQLTLSY